MLVAGDCSARDRVVHESAGPGGPRRALLHTQVIPRADRTHHPVGARQGQHALDVLCESNHERWILTLSTFCLDVNRREVIKSMWSPFAFAPSQGMMYSVWNTQEENVFAGASAEVKETCLPLCICSSRVPSCRNRTCTTSTGRPSLQLRRLYM